MRSSRLTLLALAGLCSIPPVAAGARHSFASIYNYTHFTTSWNNRYSLKSPGLNYTFHGTRHKYGPYSSLSVLLPLWGSQNGRSYYHPDVYSGLLGADLLAGVSREYPLGDHVMLVPAVGGHVNGVRLGGGPSIRSFYSLTSGLGLNMRARYRTEARTAGIVFVAGNYDFIDFIHETNKLRAGLTMTTGVGLSF